jgi:hypothetical protein
MAFGAQLTSVILILLTFLIGAFLRPAAVARVAEKVVVQETSTTIGKKTYSKLFLENQAVLDEEQALALKTFLLQHDVYATISLFDQDQSLLLARSAILQRYLDDVRLPIEACRVYTYQQEKNNQAEIEFSFEQFSNGLI